jgi:hypothetical protein
MGSLIKSLLLHLLKAVTIILVLAGIAALSLIIMVDGYAEFIVSDSLYLAINVVPVAFAIFWIWTKMDKSNVAKAGQQMKAAKRIF